MEEKIFTHTDAVELFDALDTAGFALLTAMLAVTKDSPLFDHLANHAREAKKVLDYYRKTRGHALID